jgi:hypothetical protein
MIDNVFGVLSIIDLIPDPRSRVRDFCASTVRLSSKTLVSAASSAPMMLIGS